jgi:hypothetical protein
MSEVGKLVKAMSEMTGLVQKLLEEKSSMSVTSHNHSEFEKFDPEKESVGAYAHRLSNYFEMKGIPEETGSCRLRARILLDRLKNEQYEILVAEVLPGDINEKKYSEILKLMEKKVSRKIMPLIERHRLFTRSQKECETVQEFATELKKLTANAELKCEHCKKTSTDIILTSRFVCGLNDATIRGRLLEEEDLNFEKAVNLAVTAEASKAEN